MERKWKQASGDFPPFVDWEEQKHLEGEIIKKKTVKMQGEPRNIMQIQTEDGTYTVSESAGLRALFALEEGIYVKITYLGKKKNANTGRTFKAFEVMFDEGTVEPDPITDPF